MMLIQDTKLYTIYTIAQGYNEVLRGFCGQGEGYDPPKPIMKAAVKSAIKLLADFGIYQGGDISRMENKAIFERSWQNWKQARKADGWKYGPVQDNEEKLHPNLVDYYEDLPMVEKAKDVMFLAAVFKHLGCAPKDCTFENGEEK